MKGSANLDTIPAAYLVRYAALCGAVLARAWHKQLSLPSGPRAAQVCAAGCCRERQASSLAGSGAISSQEWPWVSS
jgi:hypothetical protein